MGPPREDRKKTAMPKAMNRSAWSLGALAVGLVLAASPAASAFAQDSRAAPAQTRITEADCRNRADTDEEVVVCGRRSGEDPYRIPKGLRQKPERSKRGGTALAVETMGSGIPGAGTNIGAAGSAGTSRELYNQWLAERAEAKKADPR